MRIEPLGDRAIVVHLGDTAGEATRRRVRSSYEQLRGAAIAGVTDVVAGFSTVALHYDPVTVAADGGRSAHALIRDVVAEALRHCAAVSEVESRVIEIPVCYDPSLAPDLDDVAAHAGLTPAQVVELHAAPQYVVHMIGFLPGFPYLGGLDERLTMPRRPSPRTRVPSGSVGIGGRQTGVYPVESPGGWQLIGRSPIRLFDVGREPPSLLRMGDRVRFQPIGLDDYTSATGA